MNNFDNYIFNYLNESVIDIPRNSLDNSVWEFPDDGPPIMHPMIKTQIMSDIEEFKEIVPVVLYFAVGSILTRNYSAHSDIDINVQIDPVSDIVHADVIALVKELNGKLAPGTTHPINYFVIEDDYDLDKTNAAYDVANETWIKEPTDVNLNVQNYMNKFQSTIDGIDFGASELRRDVIDLESLKEMDEKQIKDLDEKIKAKLSEIEDSIESLVRSYKNVTTLRRQAFEKDMTPEEIRKYGKKNKLPENVVYKLLERYYYFDFIHKLEDIMKDGDISDNDVRTIKQAGKDFWK